MSIYKQTDHCEMNASLTYLREGKLRHSHWTWPTSSEKVTGISGIQRYDLLPHCYLVSTGSYFRGFLGSAWVYRREVGQQ